MCFCNNLSRSTAIDEHNVEYLIISCMECCKVIHAKILDNHPINTKLKVKNEF